MNEFLESPTAQIVLLVAVTAGLIALGFYAIGKVRSQVHEGEPDVSELLTNFRELHAKGGLSDEEYRTIKSVLGERLQQELNSTDESS